MNRKKAAGIVSAIALVGGGSAVAVDQQIDPYIEKAGHFEVQIEGETVRIAKDRPEAVLTRWGGEEALTVKKVGTYSQAKRGWFSRQQRYDGAQSVIMEPIKPVEGKNVANADTSGEEGFKVDILLNEKPNTNVFTLELEGWEDLDFFYQPELTPEEIEEGAERPENVVGSYAVYHKTKANHEIGKTNYQTGKLYHIYRPKVLDSEGNWVWGQLGYENGVLSVTVPQEFLDGAVYPVRVDPTFGYTTVGASAGSSNEIVCVSNASHSTAPENGTITALNFYVSAGWSAGEETKGGVFSATESDPDAGGLLSETSETSTGGSGWQSVGGISQSITALSLYSLCMYRNSAEPYNYSFDSLTSGGAANNGATYPTWAVLNSNNLVYSIYATYTAAPSDTCTPPTSGSWNVNAADNCVLSSNAYITGDLNLMELTGTGTFRITNGATLGVGGGQINSTSTNIEACATCTIELGNDG